MFGSRTLAWIDSNQIKQHNRKRGTMEIFGNDSITAVTAAAQARVASALAPKLTSKASNAATTTDTAKTAPAGTITSSDFLTLLVSELKNQDPTQPTDPNAYIQQLVGVNSLQQLIQINQTLDSTNTTSSTTT
jgi:flagellar basal-body rod modification protein FlgD